MQTANLLLALGGDPANTVPKYNVTTAEIAVLMAIHGEQAVMDVEPIEVIVRPNRIERARLIQVYGGAKDSNNRSIVEGMFPGVASRVYEEISELNLTEGQFKADSRLDAAKSNPKAKISTPEVKIRDSDEGEPEELAADDESFEKSPEENFTAFTVAELKEYIGSDAEIPKLAKKDDLIAIAVDVQKQRDTASSDEGSDKSGTVLD